LDTRTSRPRAGGQVRQIAGGDGASGELLPFPQNDWQGGGRNAQRYDSYRERPARADFQRRTGEREPPYPEPMPPPKRKGRRTGGGKPFPMWTVPVVMVCLGLLAVAGWFVQGEYARYAEHLGVRGRVNRNVFYQNTVVDGVDVSGMTMEQARQTLEEQTLQRSAEFAITVAHGGQTWRIDSSQVLVGAKYDTALRFAYAYGRSGSLQQRYINVCSVEENGMALTSDWGYDRVKVRELTEQIAAGITQPAADARLTAFNPMEKIFISEPERPGIEADGDRLFAEVTAALDAQRYDATIQVHTYAVQPRLRQADIAGMFGQLSSFTTNTTKDQSRNANISLSAQAINGKVVLPGETLSFNESTGQRTSAKGYREAGAIAGGQLIDATGGGVCQTSSTLFNAVVRADLEIVTRSPHAWPSAYVPRGEDAAVDWPRLDFKFRNNSEYPVFIVAWFADQKVTVEVYGKKLPPGRTIDLASVTTKETQPSNEVIYTRSLDLPSGAQRVAKEKRTGYVVETYKVYYQDGAEAERSQLWRTEYKPIQKEIYFN